MLWVRDVDVNVRFEKRNIVTTNGMFSPRLTTIHMAPHPVADALVKLVVAAAKLNSAANPKHHAFLAAALDRRLNTTTVAHVSIASASSAVALSVARFRVTKKFLSPFLSLV